MGPVDFEARERIADRERMAAPLRLSVEGRRERLNWTPQPRFRRMAAVARAVIVRLARVAGVVRGISRRPIAPSAVTPIDPIARDRPA